MRPAVHQRTEKAGRRGGNQRQNVGSRKNVTLGEGGGQEQETKQASENRQKPGGMVTGAGSRKQENCGTEAGWRAPQVQSRVLGGELGKTRGYISARCFSCLLRNAKQWCQWLLSIKPTKEGNSVAKSQVQIKSLKNSQMPNANQVTFFPFSFLSFFDTGFLYVAWAVLELAL